MFELQYKIDYCHIVTELFDDIADAIEKGNQLFLDGKNPIIWHGGLAVADTMTFQQPRNRVPTWFFTKSWRKKFPKKAR